MTPDVTVRLAIPADAAEIAAMSRDQIENGLGWSWNEARVRRSIGDRETNVVTNRPELEARMPRA